MVTRIDKYDTVQLQTLCLNTQNIVSQIRSATTPKESHVFLMKQGRPVAVVQEYHAYQTLIDRLESAERKLQIVETRERLRKLNEGAMGAVPLAQVVIQNFSPIIGDNVQR